MVTTNALDKDEKACTISIDLSKAFEITVYYYFPS